ncbi:MAG: hypothetical protein CSB55_03455 [Candidatus Cloacimonadota bacterium]|nr:MAG: hypothetical protein CSB55_03455 [Candidatus Cloacimonadota bacterium]
MKILHGPYDTCGLAVSCAEYERKIGLESDALLFFKNKTGSNSYKKLSNISFVINRPGKFYDEFYLFYYKMFRLNKKIFEYDILSFTDGNTFLMQPYFGTFFNELKRMKDAGKKMVITYQGCEVRDAPFCIKNYDYNACSVCNIPRKYWYAPRNWTSEKNKKVKLFNKYCDLIFCHNPDLMNTAPNSIFLPYLSVDYRKWLPSSAVNKNKKTVIGHAPTNRLTKGTRYVEDVIRKLKNKRNDFEFVLLENIPYRYVKEKYKEIDLFIDQLLFGWYGAVAVELMALGKPVICYIREDDLKHVPKKFAEDLPIIKANKDNLLSVIEFYLDNPEKIRALGKISRDFVTEYHDPIKIAEWLKTHYERIIDS